MIHHALNCRQAWTTGNDFHNCRWFNASKLWICI